MRNRIARAIILAIAATGLALAVPTAAQAYWVWVFYANYPTLQECHAVGNEFEQQEPDVGNHSCRLKVDGSYDLYLSVFR